MTEPTTGTNVIAPGGEPVMTITTDRLERLIGAVEHLARAMEKLADRMGVLGDRV